jgi:hypothetical protein
MKLLCINDNSIFNRDEDGNTRESQGWGLIEGHVYTTRGKKYVDEDGDECYYIDGLGSRLACRFTELLDSEVQKEEKKEFLLTPNLN